MLMPDDEPVSVQEHVRGMRLHVRLGRRLPPRGPDVILVHGLVVAGRYMMPLVRLMSGSCRVYVPDLPGYGHSEHLPHALDPAALADVLADWMDGMGLPRTAMIGNSYGCNIVAEFAVRHPERLSRAVLQGPTVDPQRRTPGRQAIDLLRNARREPPALGLLMLRDYWRAGARVALETARFALRHPIEQILPQVRQPVLVVRGGRDAIVSQRWAQRAADLLPRGQLRTVPGATHTMVYTQPLELWRVSRPFLQPTAS